MSISQSIRQGSKWLIAGSTSRQILQFGFGIVLARLLVPEDFGLIVTIQVFTGIAGFVSGGGMGQALIRSKTVELEDFQIVFTTQLLIGVLIYSLFFVVAPWFAIWFDNPIYIDLLRVSAISFLLRPFVTIHSSWLNREMMFRQRTIAGFVSLIVSSIISVAMAFNGYGVWSLTIGGLMGSVVMFLQISRLTPVKIYPKLKISRVKIYASYGIKVSANEIVSYVRKEVSNLIISRVAGAGMVGLFNKASSLGKLPFTTISGAVFMPVMREMSKVQDNLDQSRYLFYKMISLLIIYTLPIYVGLYFLAEPFIYVVYGEKWLLAAEPLQILSLAGLFYCIGHPCGAVLAAQNQLGREIIVHITGLFFIILTTYFGLKWGLTGVAWGMLGVEFITMSMMFYLAMRVLNTSIYALFKTLLPGLALNSVLVAVLLLISVFYDGHLSFMDSLNYILLSGVFGGGLYILFFLFLPLKSISSESQRWKKMLKIGV